MIEYRGKKPMEALKNKKKKSPNKKEPHDIVDRQMGFGVRKTFVQVLEHFRY